MLSMQNEIALNGRDIQLDIRFPWISINYVIVIKRLWYEKNIRKHECVISGR